MKIDSPCLLTRCQQIVTHTICCPRGLHVNHHCSVCILFRATVVGGTPPITLPGTGPWHSLGGIYYASVIYCKQQRHHQRCVWAKPGLCRSVLGNSDGIFNLSNSDYNTELVYSVID